MAEQRAARHENIAPLTATIALSLVNPTAYFLSSGASLQGMFLDWNSGEGLSALVVCACIAFALVVLYQATRDGRDLPLSPRLSLISITMVVALVFSTLGFVAPLEGQTLCFALAGAFYGIACAFLFSRWRSRLRLLDGASSLLVLSIAFVAAALISIVCFSLSHSGIMAAMNGLTPLAACIAAIPATRAATEAPFKLQPSDISGPSITHKTLMAAAAGACVCAVVGGFACASLLPGEDYAQAGTITRGSFFGFILGAAALGLMAHSSPGATPPATKLIAVSPLMAALPSLPCIIPVPPVGLVGSGFGLITGLGYAFFAVMFGWFLCCSPSAGVGATTGPDARPSVERQAAFFLTGALLCFAAALLVSPWLGDAAKTAVALILFIAYLVGFAMSFFADTVIIPADDKSSGSGQEHRPDANLPKLTADAAEEEDSPEEGRGDPIDQRCEELRNAEGLSPRETEVLRLLARGRTAAYIAETLYVSRETVKVHVRHIYEKLDVHSRSELLDLFQK